jgi:hypothetical protein
MSQRLFLNFEMLLLMLLEANNFVTEQDKASKDTDSCAISNHFRLKIQ